MRTIVLGERPSAPQEAFLRARARHIGYGGARGGGKSWAMRTKLLLLGGAYEGIQMLLLRRTLPELNENHVLPLLRQLNGVAKFNNQRKEFLFPNGSRIKLGYCAAEKDVYQYQGQEYDVIGMEEATHFSDDQRIFLTTCNRSIRADFSPRMYYTANPGGVGHAWFKRLFIDRRYQNKERAEDYVFIPARVYDNKVLMRSNPEYAETLENLPPDLRRAHLDGDWDVFAGQYFTQFRRDLHVIEPFEMPQWWPRYRAIDYGLDCAACVWAAFDELGNAYVYREYAEKNKVISEAAHDILELTPNGEVVEMTFAPEDMWGRSRESGATQDELFGTSGLSLCKVRQPRVSGWLNLAEWLKPINDGTGARARLRIFSNCTRIISELPQLQHDKRNASDVAQDPHEITHLPDALRYLMAGRPQCATAPLARDYDGAPTEAEQLQSFLGYGR